jgi:hypothetical protein
MSVTPLSIITTTIPTNARVLSSPNSSGSSSTPRITRNRQKSKSDDLTFFDDSNIRPTFSPDFDVLDTEIRKEMLTKRFTEELTEKVCNVMKQHMLDTLSSISIKPQPPPKKCCVIS